LVPGLLAALGSRIEAFLAHDVGDKLTGGFLRRELTEFAQDTRIAPAKILPGQLDDQLADVDAPSPPCLARPLPCLCLAGPAEKSGRRYDGDEVLDSGPQRFAQANQPASLPGRDHDTLQQAGTQLLLLNLSELKLSDQGLELMSHGFVRQIGQKD